MIDHGLATAIISFSSGHIICVLTDVYLSHYLHRHKRRQATTPTKKYMRQKMTMKHRRHCRSLPMSGVQKYMLVCLLFVFSHHLSIPLQVVEAAFGGEIRTFDTVPFAPNITHRQDVCSRYDKFRNGEINLRDALQGLEIHPLLRLNGYLNYDDDVGLSKTDPGLLANLMDELGQRAGFTWRNSFGILYSPSKTENVTWSWTEMLLWGVETYDVSVNWWDKVRQFRFWMFVFSKAFLVFLSLTKFFFPCL